MDRAGVGTAMLSCNIPFGDDPVAVRDQVRGVTREMNDYGRRLVSDHRGRFAVVYAHPITAPCCHDLLPGTGSHVLEWNTDTSRAIWNMINDGELAPPRVSTATRCPNVTFIWSHAGGTLLGLIQRFPGTASSADSLARTPEPSSRLYHLRRFYYDTAISANPIQMTALKALAGASQIVFGSDFPFASAVDSIQALQRSGLSADELRGVLGGNALRIFPRWKKL